MAGISTKKNMRENFNNEFRYIKKKLWNCTENCKKNGGKIFKKIS